MTLTVTCRKCGDVQYVEGDNALACLERAEAAHDIAQSECPNAGHWAEERA